MVGGTGIGEVTTNKPVTKESVERALRFVARLISEKGMVEYLPLLERIERDYAKFETGEARDPVSKARAILKALDQKAS
jgi:hypothetical protein